MFDDSILSIGYGGFMINAWSTDSRDFRHNERNDCIDVSSLYDRDLELRNDA